MIQNIFTLKDMLWNHITGTAAEQSALRMNTLAAQFDALKESIGAGLTTLFGVWIPIFRTGVDFSNRFVDMLMKIPAPLMTILGLAGGLLAMFSIATRSIQGFRLLTGVLNGAGGAATTASMGFGSLFGILGLVGVAVGGLTLAYGANFLGFRDWVDGLIDKGQEVLHFFGAGFDLFGGIVSPGRNPLSGVGGAMDTAFDAGPLNAMRRGLGAFSDGMAEAGDSTVAFAGDFVSATQSVHPTTKILFGVGYALEQIGAKSIGKGIQSVAISVEQLGDFVTDLWKGGPRTALDAYQRLPNKLKPFATVVGSGVQAVRDLSSAFKRGGFREFAIQIPASLKSIGESVDDALRQITGRGIIDWTLNVAPPKIGGWLKDAATGTFDMLIDLAGWTGGKVMDLVDWAIDVGIPTLRGWITTAARNVWDFIRGAANWTGDVVGNIRDWVLDVAAPNVIGWLKNAGENVWEAIRTAANWGRDITGRIVTWTLDTAIPNVSGWVRNAAENVWGALKSAAGWTGEVVGNLKDWALQASKPTVSFLSDLWQDVQDEVDLSWEQSGASPIPLGLVNIRVATFDIEIDFASLNRDIGSGIDTADLSVIEAKGEEHGQGIVKALAWGMDKVFSGNWWSGGGGAGTDGRASMNEGIKAYIKGLVGGIDIELDKILAPKLNEISQDMLIEFQEFSDDLQLKIQGWADTITGWFDFEWPSIDWPELKIPLPNIDFPTISDLTNMVPSYLKDFWNDPLGTLQGLVTGSDPYANTDQGTYARGDINLDPNLPGTGLAQKSPAYKQGGAKMGSTPVLSLPETGSGMGLSVPPLDTSAFDKSVSSFSGKLQSILTSVNAVFTKAIPANIFAGMDTSSSDISKGVTNWGSVMASPLQRILTAVNAIFVIAIPANLKSGMSTSNTIVSKGSSDWGSSMAPKLQAILTAATAVFVTAIPSVVRSGMQSSGTTISSQTSNWRSTFGSNLRGIQSATSSVFGNSLPNIIGGGMSSASGRISGEAYRWPGIIYGVSLYGAGVSVMHSLNSGLIAGFQAVRNTLASISAQIPRLKGPPARDRKMLIPAGLNIMESLGTGLGLGWVGVSRQLRGYEAAFSRSTTPNRPNTGSSRGGNVTNIIYQNTYHNDNSTRYTPEPERFSEFLEKAKRGDTAQGTLEGGQRRQTMKRGASPRMGRA